MRGWLLVALLLIGGCDYPTDQARIQQVDAELDKVNMERKQLEPAMPVIEERRNRIRKLTAEKVALQAEIKQLEAEARR